jgi:hypothetical protein
VSHSYGAHYIRHMCRPFLGYNIHALFHANSLAVSFFLRNKAECCHLVTPRYSTPITSVLNSFFRSAPRSLRIQAVSITHSLTPKVRVICNSDKGDDKIYTITDCDQHKMASQLTLMLSRHSLTSPFCTRPYAASGNSSCL